MAPTVNTGSQRREPWPGLEWSEEAAERGILVLKDIWILGRWGEIMKEFKIGNSRASQGLGNSKKQI